MNLSPLIAAEMRRLLVLEVCDALRHRSFNTELVRNDLRSASAPKNGAPDLFMDTRVLKLAILNSFEERLGTNIGRAVNRVPEALAVLHAAIRADILPEWRGDELDADLVDPVFRLLRPEGDERVRGLLLGATICTLLPASARRAFEMRNFSVISGGDSRAQHTTIGFEFSSGTLSTDITLVLPKRDMVIERSIYDTVMPNETYVLRSSALVREHILQAYEFLVHGDGKVA